MYSDSGQWCTFGRTAGRATRPEWIYQGVYFEPRAGDEVRIFGIYNNKQTNKLEQTHTQRKKWRLEGKEAERPKKKIELHVNSITNLWSDFAVIGAEL